MRSALFKNLSYLSLSRLLQFGVPLVLYPVIVSRIGLESFGFIAFWTGIAAFLSKVASLNIETYASRQIKIVDENSPEYSTAFFSPIVLKLSAIPIVLLPWLLISILVSDDLKKAIVIACSIHPMISVALTPSHFILGKGAFKLQFFALLVEKSSLLFVCVSFVKSEGDFWIVSVSYFISIILSGLVYIFGLSRLFRVFNFKEACRGIFAYRKIATMLTFGKLTQIHTNAAKVLVGLFFDYSIVGAYDVVEKIVNTLKIPISIIGQIKFSSVNRVGETFGCFLTAKLLVGIFFNGVLFYFGEELLIFMIGGDYAEWMRNLLAIHCTVLVATALIISFGNNVIVLYGDATLYARLMILANFLSILLFVAWVIFYSNNIFIFSGWVVASEVIFGVLCLLVGVRILKANHD